MSIIQRRVEEQETTKGKKLMKVYHYTVIFEKEDIGYHVYCLALVGCHSQGDTYEEALENIKEAIELYLESLIEDYETIPEEDVIIKPIRVAV